MVSEAHDSLFSVWPTSLSLLLLLPSLTVMYPITTFPTN